MDEPTVIRKAVPTDALNISSLAACVWVDTYAADGVFDKLSKYVHEELSEDKIHGVIRDKTVYVCCEGDRLLGYVVIGPEQGGRIEIETLYVLPRFQGKGIGKMLLGHVLESQSRTYWLSVWELNRKALGFYEKHGFKETGEMDFDLYGDKIRNVIVEIAT